LHDLAYVNCRSPKIVTPRRQRYGAYGKEQPAAQARMSRKRYREVELAPFQPLPQAAGTVFGKAYVDVRVMRQILDEKGRQQTFKRQRRHPNPNYTGLSAAQRLRAVAQQTGSPQNLPAARQEISALARQDETAGAPVEERNAELEFEVMDLSRKRRLADVKPLGSAGYSAGVGDRYKVAQMP
jgi:hypothetical protein